MKGWQGGCANTLIRISRYSERGEEGNEERVTERGGGTKCELADADGAYICASSVG